VGGGNLARVRFPPPPFPCKSNPFPGNRIRERFPTSQEVAGPRLTCTYIVRTLRCMAKMARATDRWDFRVEEVADQLVRRAADVSHRSLTDFVVEAAVVEAERVLSDRTRFVLDDEDWERFSTALDREPRDVPGLARLFASRSVFD
jgi:uncharacterized protein (DUF1778 family)